MFGRLLPREGRFYDLFNAHAEQVVRAGRELAALVHDFSNVEAHARLIDEAEHAAREVHGPAHHQVEARGRLLRGDGGAITLFVATALGIPATAFISAVAWWAGRYLL